MEGLGQPTPRGETWQGKGGERPGIFLPRNLDMTKRTTRVKHVPLLWGVRRGGGMTIKEESLPTGVDTFGKKKQRRGRMRGSQKN